MAKILCIDDFVLYAEMVARMLKRRGNHEVRAEILPLSPQEIQAFEPDLLIVNLVRKSEVLRSRIAHFYTEVDGAKALRFVVQDPLLNRFPLIITALAVEEAELPPEVIDRYLAFVEVPLKFDNLLEIIDRVVAAKGQAMAPE